MTLARTDRKARVVAAKAEIANLNAGSGIATHRTVAEWVGSSPDAKVPDHVRQRIFMRHNGICHIAGRKIRAGEPWDLDHIKALRDGGEHRESNLAPALKDKHLAKTVEENRERAVTNRKFAKHHGTKVKSGRKIAAHVNPWGYR